MITLMERISKEIKLYSRKILLQILPQSRFSFEVEPSSNSFQVRKVKTEWKRLNAFYDEIEKVLR